MFNNTMKTKMKKLIFTIIIFIFCKSTFCSIKKPEISIEGKFNPTCDIATFGSQEFTNREYVQLYPGSTDLDKFIEFLAKITHWNLVADESTKNTKICVSKTEILSVCQTWQLLMILLEKSGFKITYNNERYTVEQVQPTDALQILPLCLTPSIE